VAETVPEILTLIQDLTQQRGTSDSTLLEGVNSFYRGKFYIDIGMASTKKLWNFQTLPNVDEYAIPETYRIVTMNTAKINNSMVSLLFSREELDLYFPDAYVPQEATSTVTKTVPSITVDTGDGTDTYAFTLDDTAIVAGSFTLNDLVGVQTLTDDGAGALTGDGTGTIDYTSGAVTVVFTAAVTLGDAITGDYQSVGAGIGDGSSLSFTGSTVSTPIIQGSFIITDGVETFKDDGGLLTGTLGGSGTLNYLTGAYVITFATAPVADSVIKASYSTYAAACPDRMIAYDNTLTMRPIPDDVYDVYIEVAEVPATLTLTSTLPNTLWGEAIAYGTAMEFMRRTGDDDNAMKTYSFYKEKLETVLKYAYKQRSANTARFPRW